MRQEITGKDELLRLLAQRATPPRPSESFRTRFEHLNELLPGDAFRRGAVHELLTAPTEPALVSFAMLLAGAVQSDDGRGSDAVVAWSNPARELYAPALAASSLPLARLVLLRPRRPADELRMVMECLRCPGVAVTVVAVGRLTRVEARRLQLAAERGGVGLFLRRSDGHAPAIYAAATRWLVTPASGDERCQRWSVELVHGHGGRVGESILLEVDRESGQVHALRPPSAVADRPAAAASARASA